jgi:F0F1-type ATP synthase membrane subunit b/b'
MSPYKSEEERLILIVEVLALLTTILAIISGYTVYRSHREATDARHAAGKTLDEARSALNEAKSTLETSASIKAKLEAAQLEILAALNQKRTSFEEELKRNKTMLEQELKQEKATLIKRMEEELEMFRSQLHESTTINRTKAKLLELLCDSTPNPDKIFPLLTDIINYPDQRSIEIYERLLEVFAKDGQIVAKVKLGLQIFRERHYNSGSSVK